jgi:polysaccharide deacetylase family protein (PEP-CTERM system associated)
MKKACLLTFDVEEWFQVENLKSAIQPEDWTHKKSSVIQNTNRILDILDKFNITTTFFILGWLAEKYPEMISSIHSAGHEIACHGFAHELTFELTEEELRKDIKRSKRILEDIIGQPVLGYRSPSFSIHPKMFQILKEHNFRYDSSYNPFTLNSRYSRLETPLGKILKGCYKINNGLYEIPVSTVVIKNFNIPIAGGGYFRLFPFFLSKLLIKKRLRDEDMFNFYLHPWEFEPAQPRIENIPLTYRFRHYYGLHQTATKFQKLIKFLKEQECVFYRINHYLDFIEDSLKEK